MSLLRRRAFIFNIRVEYVDVVSSLIVRVKGMVRSLFHDATLVKFSCRVAHESQRKREAGWGSRVGGRAEGGRCMDGQTDLWRREFCSSD